MVSNRKDDDKLAEYTETERMEARFKRRAIIKKLYAQGYSNQWGFAAAVAEQCVDAEIIQNAEAIQGDIVAVEADLAKDTTTTFGRTRTLELLKNELMALAEMDCTDEEGNFSDFKRLTVLKSKLAVIKQIRELEGQDEPSMVKHKHVHSVHHLVQTLPPETVKRLGDMDTVEELEAFLVSEVGAEDARKLITAVSSASESP